MGDAIRDIVSVTLDATTLQALSFSSNIIESLSVDGNTIEKYIFKYIGI